MPHFITIDDAPDELLQQVMDAAFALREQRIAGQPHDTILRGRTLAMLFEKPSLRTRVSFHQAMIELGGSAIVLSRDEVGLGRREGCGDVARVLSGMVHGIAARVFEHAKLEELAAHSDVPVINMLSDRSHPCQALADLLTMMDVFGRDLTGRTLAYIGDGNNVARSLATLCLRMGVHFVLASPKGYELEGGFVNSLATRYTRATFTMTGDPREAAARADVIYTDTWVSMGQEEEKARRLRDFEGFAINDELLMAAPSHAVVMHCLPAYRNVEITDSVMDGPRSVVFPQAHNRLHAQKGLLAVLLGGMDAYDARMGL